LTLRHHMTASVTYYSPEVARVRYDVRNIILFKTMFIIKFAGNFQNGRAVDLGS